MYFSINLKSPSSHMWQSCWILNFPGFLQHVLLSWKKRHILLLVSNFALLYKKPRKQAFFPNSLALSLSVLCTISFLLKVKSRPEKKEKTPPKGNVTKRLIRYNQDCVSPPWSPCSVNNQCFLIFLNFFKHC